MGRKKIKDKDLIEDTGSSFLTSIKQDTLETISAVVFILISIFLISSPFGKAGIVGDKVYHFFNFLFGIGYYLLPIILLSLGFSLLRSLHKKMLAWPKIVGGVLMLIAGLGILDLSFEKGGVVGNLINKPLDSLFGMWMTIAGHTALMIISIIMIFEFSLKIETIKNLFTRKEKDESDDVKEIKIKTKEEDDSEDEDEEENEDDEKNKKTKKGKEDEEEEEAEEAEIKIKQPENKKSNGLIFFQKRPEPLNVYQKPPLSLLEKDSGKPDVGDIKANANIIKRTLSNFGIQVEMDEVSIGPSVTRYALKPAEGVKLSRIVALHSDLSLALAAHPLRIEAPIPGKSLVGIEIPNSSKSIVGLGSLFKNDEFNNSPKPLMMGLGRGVTGISHFASLAKMPHLLIAGATGSGKSVTIHALITSLLYRNSPEFLKFIMVDPKRVELTTYNKIPHLLTPVITDPRKTILALKWAGKEMSRRYDVLESHGVRDIASYHKNILEPAIKESEGEEDAEIPETMPYIVVIIDELADIMQTFPRELEANIVRLAQMSRAVGIHLIISTQRPSVNVITGLIKANIPARIALQVASQIDSRTILDMPGAEKLLGAGDMLFLSGDISQPIRIQSAFISEEEVKKVVKYLTSTFDTTFNENIDFEENNQKDNAIFAELGMDSDSEDEDELFNEAKQIVIGAGKASTSYLQRKLKIGYSRAARIMDILEEKGIIGPADGAKPREVIAKSGDEYSSGSDENGLGLDSDSEKKDE